MINFEESSECWGVQKEKLKQKLSLLTDGDVLLIEGKIDDMLARLQVKLGKTKEEILELIADL